MIQQLLADGAAGRTLGDSDAYQCLRLDEAAAKTALQILNHEPEDKCYLLLMALYRDQPKAVERVPEQRRAAILVKALTTITWLNDFGMLGPDGWEDVAGRALLETCRFAPGLLVPLLDDRRPAQLWGSETATVGELYQYRRCDYAFRYLSLLLGEEPAFDADPGQRDEHIEKLRERIPAPS